MGKIELSQVEKWFGETQVIKGINLKIFDGEFLVFVGPSGCGKSTLLRMIGGLEETSRGKIIIDGADVTNQPPSKRGLSMVFQSYALYPHLNVQENMGFPLKTAGATKSQIKESVMRVAKILKLEDYLISNHLSASQSKNEQDRWNRIHSGYKESGMLEGGSLLFLEGLLMSPSELNEKKKKSLIKWLKSLQLNSGYFPYHAELKSQDNLMTTIKSIYCLKMHYLLK